MKVKEVNIVEEKKFKPFSIHITVEKELDLVELWAMFNQAKTTLLHDVDDKFTFEYAETFKTSKLNSGTKDIWDILNKKVIEYNMEKDDELM